MRLLLLLCMVAALAFGAEPKQIPLDAPMRKIGVDVASVTYKGRKALRVTYREGEDGRSLAILPDTQFGDGVIEYDFAGDVQPNSPPAYRGFTGLAFRVQRDDTKYECFYQRPLNSASNNPEQRTHTVQYISMPEYTWNRLREETPGKYEAWAAISPGEWTHAKIEVKGDTARLYLNGAQKPALVVEPMKHGVTQGALALWVGVGTVAHFANLTVTREAAGMPPSLAEPHATPSRQAAVQRPAASPRASR